MDIKAELKDLMENRNYSTAFVATATGLAKFTTNLLGIGTNYGKMHTKNLSRLPKLCEKIS